MSCAAAMDLTRTAHRLRPDLPIVLCTAVDEGPDPVSLPALGVRCVVHMPFEPEELFAAVAAPARHGLHLPTESISSASTPGPLPPANANETQF